MFENRTKSNEPKDTKFYSQKKNEMCLINIKIQKIDIF